MSYFPDLGTSSMMAQGDYVRAVGWLHPDHAYSKGQVPAVFVERLKQFVEQSGNSALALYFGACGGMHTCEFCGRANGIANFGVPDGDHLFVAPEMIVHYIAEHEYCPPKGFVEAVMCCPLPESEEYQIITEPFWQLHKSKIDRFFATKLAQPNREADHDCE